MSEPLSAPRWTVFAALALVAVHLLLLTNSARVKSATADEYTYISTGYLYVNTGDFRLDRTHPPLTRLLIGASLHQIDLNLPDLQQDQWGQPISQRLGYDIGWRMVLDGANNPDDVLFWARLPIMLLSCALAVLLLIWGWWLYGDIGGLVVLAFYCFSPNILAHGRLATLDLGACFFMTLALLTLDLRRNSPAWRWTLAAGAALGLALSAKATAILLLPVFAAVLVFEKGNPARLSRPLWINTMKHALLLFAVATGVLFLTYGFPFKPVYYFDTLQNVFYKSLNTGEGAVDVPGMPHLNYAFYLFGDYSTQGWPYYSLAAFLVKTPVALLIAVAFTLTSTRRWMNHTDSLVLSTIVLVFLASAFNQVNIGLRHVLPVYPLLFLYVGRLALQEKLGQKAALGFLIIWFAAASCMAYPNYIPFFNAAAGGAENGHAVLDDSNLDWGQDLGRLKQVAEANPDTPLYIATNWMFDPSAYGFEAQRLQDGQIQNPPKGLVAVGKHWAVRNRINKRSPAYFDWIETYQPIDDIGGSIWLFRFE